MSRLDRIARRAKLAPSTVSPDRDMQIGRAIRECKRSIERANGIAFGAGDGWF